MPHCTQNLPPRLGASEAGTLGGMTNEAGLANIGVEAGTTLSEADTTLPKAGSGCNCGCGCGSCGCGTTPVRIGVLPSEPVLEDVDNCVGVLPPLPVLAEVDDCVGVLPPLSVLVEVDDCDGLG